MSRNKNNGSHAPTEDFTYAPTCSKSYQPIMRANTGSQHPPSPPTGGSGVPPARNGGSVAGRPNTSAPASPAKE